MAESSLGISQVFSDGCMLVVCSGGGCTDFILLPFPFSFSLASYLFFIFYLYNFAF